MSSRITVARGRHGIALDGQRVPTVTTVIGHALNKPALPFAAAKEVAIWAATHADLLAVKSEAEWIDEAKGAAQRAWRAKAQRGTDTHADTLKLLSGQADDVPAERLGIVTQAARFMDTWQVDEIAAERPCANTIWRYGGTFDVIAKMRDGRTWLLDWKTGSGPYAEHALQAVGYANADIYQDADGNDQPMPDIDRLGIVMLDDDSWDLMPVVGNQERMFDVFKRQIFVSHWVEDTTPNRQGIARETVFGDPLPVPTVAAS